MSSLPLTWAGETWELYPQRALYWPRRNALLLADLHLGKGDAFRSRGMAIPSGSSAADLARLSELLRVTGAEELWVLGDLVHGPISAELARLGQRWREAHPALRWLLVRGNHDRHAPRMPEAWRLQEASVAIRDSLLLAHAPDDVLHATAGSENDSTPFSIVGHVHPAVRLTGGADSLRAPAFWLRPQQLVLPAFGSFTGGQRVNASAADRLFAVGPEQVIEVPVHRSHSA